MIAGSMQMKKGYYYAVIRLSKTDNPKWHRTGVKVDEKRANERATEIMYDIIRDYESKQKRFTLNKILYVEV